MSKDEAFTVKDSGERRDFTTGSRRDVALGKPAPDLISPFLQLRLANHLTLGKVKYGRHNWSKGQPNSVAWESFNRHRLQADLGMEDEDHLSAMVFNLMIIIHNQELKKMGMLPPELDDWPVNWCQHINGGDPRVDDPPNADSELMARVAKELAEYTARMRDYLAKENREWIHANGPETSDRAPGERD
jgi:hypothetical protein